MSVEIVRGAVSCALAALAFLAAPAYARNRELGCTEILRVEGGFTYRAAPGLSVLALARADGPFQYENPGNIVGFACLRTALMPDAAADLEVLQAGYVLSLGDNGAGLRVLEIELADGRINARMTSGALAPREQQQLDRIVAAMQARLGAAAR